MKIAFVFACVLGMAVGAAVTPVRQCEDAPIDCAAKDEEMDICKDPIDSVAYCPRYCGKCHGSTPVPKCHDYDHLCPTLVNSEYCQLEIARELCAKSCGLCDPPTTTTTTTTTTTEAPTTTEEMTTTTTMRYTEIPDPNCQDVDPDCITLLQIHYCGDEPIVRKLCQRSCNLCPTILVPVTDVPEISTKQPDLTTKAPTEGPTPEKECRDNDAMCAEPSTVDNCATDELLPLLCPVTCGVCQPAVVVTTTVLPEPEETTIPDTTTEETTEVDCRDHSEDCDKLAPSCSFDPLVVQLCPETCMAGPCKYMTEKPATEEVTTQGEPETTMEPEVTTEAEAETTIEQEVTTEAEMTTEAETTMEPEVTTEEVEETTTAEMMTTEGQRENTTLKALCEDIDSQCPALVQNFFCETNELLRHICKKSCDECGSGNVSPPTDTTCRDHDPKCPGMVAECENTGSLVSRVCPLSCNLCEPETTVPATSSGPMTTPKPTESGPLQCRVCVDPFCEQEIESVQQCPAETPYCSSQIINNADGTHGVTKRCATRQECAGWYTGLAAGDDTTCSNYDPNQIVQAEFICFYCCTSNECNSHTKPLNDTLYRPS